MGVESLTQIIVEELSKTVQPHIEREIKEVAGQLETMDLSRLTFLASHGSKNVKIMCNIELTRRMNQEYKNVVNRLVVDGIWKEEVEDIWIY